MTGTEQIVVGVDGTAGSRAAVTYAAREADRLHTGVTIVHVSPDYVPVAGIYPISFPLSGSEARAVGRKILEAAADEARAVIGPDRVRTELVTGGRVSALVKAAEGARAIVLGDQRRKLIDRLATGAVLGGVAARSTAPVVVVPGEWVPAAHGMVIAAVKTPAASPGLIDRALAVAADRGARLVLLHAWELPSLYDDMMVPEVDEAAWEEDARVALTTALDSAHGPRSDVEVEVRIVHGQPARCIVDASQSADLVLLARRAHAFPLGYFGSTGRTVVRDSCAPVVVLPPAREAEGLRSSTPEEL